MTKSKIPPRAGKLLILVILLLVSIPNIVSLSNYAFAESVDTAWVRRYNGPGNSSDQARAISVDASGYVYVTGVSIGGCATIKYYPNGDTVWLRTYSFGFPFDMVVDDSGCVYVVGQADGDYVTMKLYPDGDTAWVRRYGGPDYEEPAAIGLDDFGNVYVTGSSGASVASDYATIKYYPNGDTAWIRKYNGPASDNDHALALAVDGLGNVFVTGFSWDGTHYDYMTIKYDPEGDTVWVRSYDGPANSSDQAYAIEVDGSGNVYVTGYSSHNSTYPYNLDYATVKYFANGDTAWVRRYNGPGDDDDVAFAIAVDDSGNVYVCGESWGSGTGRDYATLKYDSNGDTAWVRRYNGTGNSHDEPAWRGIAVDGLGNVSVTGKSYGSGTDWDYATISYDQNGNVLWVERYNGPGNNWDEAYSIAIDGSGNVYVTGKSEGSGKDYDYATIKYVQSPGDVKDETADKEKPSEFALSQNYPNPFNQATKIEFTLAKSGFVSLNIYDILGRKVRTLVSEHLSVGYKSVLWDGKNDSGKEVASGIYFYQLKTMDFTETKKLVLLK